METNPMLLVFLLALLATATTTATTTYPCRFWTTPDLCVRLVTDYGSCT